MQTMIKGFIGSELLHITASQEIPPIEDPKHLIITLATIVINLIFIAVDRREKKKAKERRGE